MTPKNRTGAVSVGDGSISDLMDGFTFGVVAGVGFACFETLVLHWGWISGGFTGPGSGAGTWICRSSRPGLSCGPEHAAATAGRSRCGTVRSG